jgi:hypothetical protein
MALRLSRVRSYTNSEKPQAELRAVHSASFVAAANHAVVAFDSKWRRRYCGCVIGTPF